MSSKKIVFLSFILLLFCSIANAGIISFDAFDSATTISQLNTAMNRVYSEFNGSIESVNIKDGTIVNADMASSVSPVTRDSELIGDMVYSGLLPATSTDLTSDISAGTCYVNGYRIVKDATSKTYTASKDTWVYIDQNGAFSYTAVNNSAAQPSTPNNSILLAKVVTDATPKIASITDLRQTTPVNLRIYQDYVQGCVISRDIATANKISIDVGEIELGTSGGGVRRNIAPVYVNFGTTGRGALDTGTLAAGYYYIHAIADDDNSTNFEGIGSLSPTAPTGYSNTRLIGWCYANSASTISPDSVGAYRGRGGDAPNIVSISWDGVVTSSTSFTNIGLARFVSAGRPVGISYGEVSSGNATLDTSLRLLDGTTELKTATFNLSAINAPFLNAVDWVGKLSPGEHTINIQTKVGANTKTTYDGRQLTIIEY